MDAADRLGVYTDIEDVPECYRLHRYEAEYAGRDVWKEFCETAEYGEEPSAHFLRAVDRSGNHWRDHMRARRRHHALATPTDVETWCQSLLSEKSTATAYNYWVRIRRFYEWLQWHVDHPHCYDPVLMAVVSGGAAGEIWEEKLRKWRNARARYDNNE
jgi:hypothetical protein